VVVTAEHGQGFSENHGVAKEEVAQTVGIPPTGREFHKKKQAAVGGCYCYLIKEKNMDKSHNGWPVLTVAPKGKLKWITGSVLEGDVTTLFDYLCKEFDSRVEKIRVGESCGWAHRYISGTTIWSNHSSGTAIDLNPKTHVQGKQNTFNPAQTKEIEAILKELDNVIGWGGKYPPKSPADEMHFEVKKDTTPDKVAEVAKRLGKPDWSDPKSKITPNFSVGEATLLPKFGIYHIPNDTEKSNITKLANAIQKVRDVYGKPMNISNWIRPIVTAGKLDSSGKIVKDPQSKYNGQDYNAAITNKTTGQQGGSPTSKHKTGLAVDIRDGDRTLTNFLLKNQKLLGDNNLWMEDEKSAHDWVHLDLGDRSKGEGPGRERIFKV